MTTHQDRDSLLAEAVALRTADRTEQARQRLLALGKRFPEDAEIAYQTAWAHDRLGLEAEAAPFYEAALAGELSPADRRGGLLGLGSTYRILGRYEEAVRTLRTGTAEFPADGALRTFLAMALYKPLGRGAVGLGGGRRAGASWLVAQFPAPLKAAP